MVCNNCGRSYVPVGENGLCKDCDKERKWGWWKKIKSILAVIAAIGIYGVALLPALVGLGLIVVFVFFTWDYHTGQDTGYISAVDKMTLSEDKKIYLRRRPLDSFMTTEGDEHIYCTTADREDVIEKAYKAMESGKRVVVVYNEARPFGPRNWGHCNQAPIADIKVVEEDNG